MVKRINELNTLLSDGKKKKYIMVESPQNTQQRSCKRLEIKGYSAQTRSSHKHTVI